MIVVTRRQLPWVEGSLREVLTKRRYVLRMSRGDWEIDGRSTTWLTTMIRNGGVDKRSMTRTWDEGVDKRSTTRTKGEGVDRRSTTRTRDEGVDRRLTTRTRD